MKPEDLVPTRQTCIALKAAGFPQATCFHWTSYGGDLLARQIDVYLPRRGETVIAAAPSLAEILEQLQLPRSHTTTLMWQFDGYSISTDIMLGEHDDERVALFQYYSNPAEAAARLWIKVKEGK